MSDKSYGIAKTGVSMKVNLSELETKICGVLQGVSNLIATERPELPRIESRIAGGWVRDKLLGKECHDLDIAINDMMGYEFATYVNRYLESQGVPIKSIGKIDSNPEKSKHLETATTKLFNQEVDFCNLRKEVYEEGSRIPSKVTFGTPTEDAYRRDTTINSLFYNVNSHMVEDLTEQGIADLIEGIIRTPLAPFETFHEDPLRVLRCIRFASRFDFEMEPELREAAKNPEIKSALINKVSRERVGIEYEKMITGPNPLLSLGLIHELDLYSVVMSAPTNIKSGSIGEASLAINAVGLLEYLKDAKFENLKAASSTEKRLLVLSASALPYLDVISEVKKKDIPTVQLVLRDSIKTTNGDVSSVSTLFRGINLLKDLADQNEKETVSRSELGMVIRDLGALWTTAVKLTAVKEILDNYADVKWSKPELVEPHIGDELSEKYEKLIQLAKVYNMSDCYTWKNMIDGKTAAQIVGVKPGPVVTELLRAQMIWQLEHPEGTKEECKEALQTYWENKK